MEDRCRIVFYLGNKSEILYSNNNKIDKPAVFGLVGIKRDKGMDFYPDENILAIKKNRGSFTFVSPQKYDIFYDQLINQTKS